MHLFEIGIDYSTENQDFTESNGKHICVAAYADVSHPGSGSYFAWCRTVSSR